MKKNTVRLTESQLHKVIKESVKRVLKENGGRRAGAENDYKHRFEEKVIMPVIDFADKSIQSGDVQMKIKAMQKLKELLKDEELKYQGLFVDDYEMVKGKMQEVIDSFIRA